MKRALLLVSLIVSGNLFALENQWGSIAQANPISILASSILASEYVESNDGELSDDGNSPTALVFAAGTNRVTGTMGGDLFVDADVDNDIFTFTIPTAHKLTSIYFTEMNPAEAEGNGSLFAIGAGNNIDISGTTNHLSNILINGTGEWLDHLADRNKEYNKDYSTGLSKPVGAGDYTILFTEFSHTVDYTIDLTIAPVPEPSSLGLSAIAGLAFLFRRRPRGCRFQ